MSKEELTLEKLKLENEQLKFEIEKKKSCYPSWIIFPLMWAVYGIIHILITSL